MKILILICIYVAGTCLGKTIQNGESQPYNIKKLGLTIDDIASKETIAEVSKAYVNGIFDIEINSLFDGLLDLLSKLIIDDGIEPLPLGDQKLELLGILGSLQLSSGSLQELSTIKRDDDVIISYHTSTKKVSFILPLGFDELTFNYQYKSRITLLSVSGGIEGKLKNMKLNLKITYDPNIRKLTLDSLSMRNSGKVSVKFSGNALVDWLSNAITSVVTTVLHPVIILVVQSVVQSIGNEVIDAVNDFING